MQFTQKARNILRAVVQRHSTAGMKKRLWDSEFSGGRWDCLDNTPGDCIYTFLEKYARKGSILDLGCGSGNTASELSDAAYADYVGVDISDVAIQKAISKTREAQRENKHRFVQSEFFSFVPDKYYDIVLFRDSIYYVPLGRVTAMLKRYANYLSRDGVFVVRLWGSEKNQSIIDLITANFTVLETYSQDNPKTMILVFR
ncbi:MAG TPA: class I SAM-dependent methyltransferase [Nitrospiraceae bacterium]|nr:class I SAM-dependent methyltransferase [Nitrospiraceae bacterium]